MFAFFNVFCTCVKVRWPNSVPRFEDQLATAWVRSSWAMIFTSPEATCSSVAHARTPEMWSMWLCSRWSLLLVCLWLRGIGFYRFGHLYWFAWINDDDAIVTFDRRLVCLNQNRNQGKHCHQLWWSLGPRPCLVRIGCTWSDSSVKASESPVLKALGYVRLCPRTCLIRVRIEPRFCSAHQDIPMFLVLSCICGLKLLAYRWCCFYNRRCWCKARSK